MTDAIHPLLLDLTTAYAALLGASAVQAGLRRGDRRALEIVVRHSALTAGELSLRAGATTGAITGIVDRLVAAGYVRRVEDVTDRRLVRVAATPRGDAVHRQTWALIEARVDRMLEAYSATEIGVVRGFLATAREVAERAVAERETGRG